MSCKTKHIEGSLFCSVCGKELDPTLELEAIRQAKAAIRLPDPPTEPELTLIIVTRLGSKPISLPFGQRTILGRADRDGKNVPHLDLTPFGGVELGVSRQHAVIDYDVDVTSITDLGSTNGSFLNNKPLEPYQARILRYGDELRLGKLVIAIYTY